MTFSVTICTVCGTPFDETGYDKCPDCQFDHRFIKLRKQYEETNNETKESQQSNEGI